MIDEILKFNKKFVENKEYERFITDKYPNMKIAIVTCMDTRLVELLPAALGLKNGDVKMIKNAGGAITNPFDSTMRSILVSVYELGVNTIMVVGHTNCGVQGMTSEHFINMMENRGIDKSTMKLMEYCGVDLKKWLTGFEETPTAVKDTVDLIKNNPLLPSEVEVKGFVIDSVTGELMPVD